MGNTDAPVLVVDDHADTRELIRRRLEADSFKVIEAENGKVALDLLMSEGPERLSVMILDLDMPVMTGWELVAILKRYHRFARVPVIVVSGIAPHLRQIESIMHHAIVASIPKACDLERLVAMVNEYAREQRYPS